MSVSLSERERVHEEIEKWVWPRPLRFEEFLDLFMGREEIVELVRGSVIIEMAAQFDHEDLIAWLLAIARYFAEERDLGKVVSSRMAVRIDDFTGRLPDLVFVRKERLAIFQQRAIYGAPDLVIEVRSPGDRRSSVVELETDYRSLGVSEIVLIDPKRRLVRIARKRGDDYEDHELKNGTVETETFPGFRLDLEWLFDNDRPTVPWVIATLSAGTG
jgi:Uma2 family endonuclease